VHNNNEIAAVPDARPVVFGEVLFDCFEDASAVLGGAPFNVAWHLQGFGLAPLFVSRVGADALGERVRKAMQTWGMDEAGLQIDPERPTGTVRVALAQGQPSFTIVPEQSYDHIDGSVAQRLLERTGGSCLYHGTLIARHAVSRAALDVVRARGLPTFVDVNLREPWWSPENVAAALQGARWAKLNDAELAALAGTAEPFDLESAAAALRVRYGFELLVVTRGEHGALVVTRGGQLPVRAPQVPDLADTVGAGDAFSAVMLLGVLQGWSLATTLSRAAGFAAETCRHRGALREDRSHYRTLMEEWQMRS
jgi:fructokinase